MPGGPGQAGLFTVQLALGQTSPLKVGSATWSGVEWVPPHA